MRADRGFVLVNALVLVAAFAAAAAFVLARAETARLRQAETQGAGQAVLYLDAFESLAISLLLDDQRGPATDTPGDAWAQADYSVTIDRGRVSGDITDLQGRFNVNWLANPEDANADAAFARLVSALGLPGRVAREITGFVRPGGPANGPAYARLRPPVAPVGGPVVMLDQLRGIPTLEARDLDRLRPYLAALSSDSRLNVNTADPLVVWSLLPGAKREGLAGVLRNRARRPFVSVDDFKARVAPVLGDNGIAEEEEFRLAVGSDWFRADIAVELEGRILRRQTIIERRQLPFGPRVALRLEARP